ncbi:type II toxin-antitoxin system RelE family toxin [Pseudarthrobacter sp. S9]|uniref:type II toxin-antitoxin system RelE family toxin n=1 Tax=Pseudarthrobacter sp. S9 TaxID=3418421 RepID=UPI003D03B575
MNLAASRYEVRLSDAARKQLHKFDRSVQRFLLEALSLLADNPRPPTAKSLAGRSGQLRVRVRDYRIIYQIRDQELLVLVVAIGHRREIYNK